MKAEDLRGRIERLREDMVGWRRHLHRNPELSFHEHETSRFVHDTLKSFGGLELSRPTGTSVMARLVGGSPGRTVALRADMDALPIQEENGHEFVSASPGTMHACGHDGHTAMLLAVAKLFSESRDEIPGEVRFFFQHAEELYPGGAEQMVEAGVMDGVDAVLGAHLWSPMPTGGVGVAHGPAMASPDTFRITIKGAGGHAAMPHEAVDPIAAGAQVVTNLQHLVARNADPLKSLVLSVTRFSGGTANNVIPETAELEGTVRVFDAELREEAPRKMERIIKGVTEAHGAEYDLQYQFGYRPVINDETLSRLVEDAARESLGESAVEYTPPVMGGEDFSAYQQRAPGAFFYVGARNEERGIVYPHHHPRFDVDEDALEVGVNVLVGAATKLLRKEKSGA